MLRLRDTIRPTIHCLVRCGLHLLLADQARASDVSLQIGKEGKDKIRFVLCVEKRTNLNNCKGCENNEKKSRPAGRSEGERGEGKKGRQMLPNQVSKAVWLSLARGCDVAGVERSASLAVARMRRQGRRGWRRDAGEARAAVGG